MTEQLIDHWPTRDAFPLTSTLDEESRARRIDDRAEFSATKFARERDSRPFISGTYAARCSRRWPKGRVSNFLTLFFATSSLVQYSMSLGLPCPCRCQLSIIFTRGAFRRGKERNTRARNRNVLGKPTSENWITFRELGRCKGGHRVHDFLPSEDGNVIQVLSRFYSPTRRSSGISAREMVLHLSRIVVRH